VLFRAVWIAFTVTLPLLAQADLVVGKRIFESQCALCHGQDGRGGRGPSLAKQKFKHAADDGALRSVISDGIPGTEMPGSWQLHPREVASVAAYVTTFGRVAVEVLPGNAARGAAVYQAQGCAGCHIVQGQGGAFGPELTEIGDKRSAAYLRDAIVKPSAAVPDGFLLVEVVTAAGMKIRGVRLNEDSFTIQLKDAKMQFHSLRKSQLKDLRKLAGESPMPAYSLAGTELDDLVAYLASLRGKP
jgi:cytochrome c oxidase cbb3-type subunit 3